MVQDLEPTNQIAATRKLHVNYTITLVISSKTTNEYWVKCCRMSFSELDVARALQIAGSKRGYNIRIYHNLDGIQEDLSPMQTILGFYRLAAVI